MYTENAMARIMVHSTLVDISCNRLVIHIVAPVQDFKEDLYAKWATGAAYCISSVVMKKIRDILR